MSSLCYEQLRVLPTYLPNRAPLFPTLVLPRNRSYRNFHQHIFPSFPIFLPISSRVSILTFKKSPNAQSTKVIQPLPSNQIHITTFSSIPSIWPPLIHKLLPTEANTSFSTFSSYHSYPRIPYHYYYHL